MLAAGTEAAKRMGVAWVDFVGSVLARYFMTSMLEDMDRVNREVVMNVQGSALPVWIKLLSLTRNGSGKLARFDPFGITRLNFCVKVLEFSRTSFLVF